MTKDLSGVTIRTPARLHFSLIDLNGELGRVDGGIGVALEKPNWIIKITKNEDWIIPSIIDEFVTQLRERMTIDHSYKIEFKSTLPEHVGLGSQTQLMIAVAHGISILEDKKYTILELAQLVGRGGTSGIGIAAYEHGGFIFDGGHCIEEKPKFLPSHFSKATPAVLVQRHHVPQDWHFVIAVPDIGKGKYGSDEVEIFNKYCPISATDVEKLSRIILMQIMPAMIESDIIKFGDGLNRIQKLGFKHIENQIQDQFITDLQAFFLANGAVGSGLSSFGPATYGVVKSKSIAEKLTAQTKLFLTDHGQVGSVFYTRVNNSGVKIEAIE